MGTRIGIVTHGGSWGVMLTDQLGLEGFNVAEFSAQIQEQIRKVGLPYRASSKNPVDFGAAGHALDAKKRIRIVETILASPETDALIIHGYGENAEEEAFLRESAGLMERYRKPLLIGSHITPFESPSIRSLVMSGIPVYHRLEDIADILSAMRSDGINRYGAKESFRD
jgi:acyl-CoA synthetase (NDP forming)